MWSQNNRLLKRVVEQLWLGITNQIDGNEK